MPRESDGETETGSEQSDGERPLAGLQARSGSSRAGMTPTGSTSTHRPRPRLLARWAATAFVADGVVLLVLLAVGAPRDWSFVAQALLMPLLLVWALARLPSGRRLPLRIAVPMAIALLCSAVGDTLPGFLATDDDEVQPGTSLSEGTAPFIVRIIAFAFAQIAWALVAAPWRRTSILRPGVRPLVLAYAAAAVVVLVLAAPGAGFLVIAMIPYAAIVTTTAVLVTGLGPAGGVGSVLILLSGAMFGIFKFAPLLDPGEPTHSLSIMIAYLAAQAMLVIAVRGRITSGGWPVPPEQHGPRR